MNGARREKSKRSLCGLDNEDEYRNWVFKTTDEDDDDFYYDIARKSVIEIVLTKKTKVPLFFNRDCSRSLVR